MIINWFAEYLFSFVEVFLSFIFCEAFFEKKGLMANKLSYLTISFVLATVVIALNHVQLFSILNTAVFFILYCITGKFFFKASWIKVIGVELTYFVLLFISDTIIFTFAAQLAGISTTEVLNNFSDVRIVGGIGTKMLLSTICYCINKLLDKNRTINRKAFALGFTGTIILIVLSVVIYYRLAASKENNGMIILLFIFMLALFFSTFIVFILFLDSQRKKQENELIHQQNIYLERSLKEQENTFLMWKKSIHDYKHTILALDSLIEQNKMRELFDYIHNEKAKFEHGTILIHTGNSTVDAIINAKYSTAQKNGISVMLNVKLSGKCAVSNIHLAEIIGNLLDNAIEAQENEPEPFIHVQITTVGELLIIKIVNKCRMPPEGSESSKKDKQFHGIGLKSVKKTAEQYGGDFSLKYENDTAVATVIIPNKI